jgi:hypothetical protein
MLMSWSTFVDELLIAGLLRLTYRTHDVDPVRARNFTEPSMPDMRLIRVSMPICEKHALNIIRCLAPRYDWWLFAVLTQWALNWRTAKVRSKPHAFNLPIFSFMALKLNGPSSSEEGEKTEESPSTKSMFCQRCDVLDIACWPLDRVFVTCILKEQVYKSTTRRFIIALLGASFSCKSDLM